MLTFESTTKVKLSVKMGVQEEDVPIIDITSFQRVCDSLQNLESLTLLANKRFSSDFNGQKIQLKNVKRFKLMLWKLKMPFLFNQLDILIYSPHIEKSFNYPIDDIYFYKFIKERPTITKLRVIFYNSMYTSYGNHQKIAKFLPMLEEVNFDSEPLIDLR